ncbi:hypothetical protein K474DRAFT_1665790 [Panus rudis PR-1116 ss-1]|nr:hypothetical protein K474DRAFT_1665790 [Panus rudis PR-1116 ss-1]
MATLQYVEIPPGATRLESAVPSDIRPAPKILTNLPHPEKGSGGLASPSSPQPMSPSAKTGIINIQQILLSSALPIPANVATTPRTAGKDAPRLLSTRDPLSIPITTVNFRRFVSKVGPVFWLQDRIEEIVMWRKGWQYTTVWMAVYAYLCYFPRLALLLPFVMLLGIVLATDPALKQPDPDHTAEDVTSPTVPPPPPMQTGEGSVDWLANVQAIQNLMGFFSDAHDLVLPYIPHLNHTSPYTPVILTAVLASLLVLIPIIHLLPMRTTMLTLGLTPLFFTHPFTRGTLIPALYYNLRPHLKHYRLRLIRFVDDDRLEDKHWRTEMQEVELWENERWSPSSSASADSSNGTGDASKNDAGWSKANLRPGERKAWTRGRDGWSAVSEDGTGDVSSNLTFSLSPGWLFVETEDWRPDLEGSWLPEVGADEGIYFVNLLSLPT